MYQAEIDRTTTENLQTTQGEYFNTLLPEVNKADKNVNRDIKEENNVTVIRVNVNLPTG
jgi:hypothetical protein